MINEWHENARLEAYFDPLSRSFIFFRNGIYVAKIGYVSETGYLSGFGVKRSLQGTGLGKAMLHFVFKKTKLSSVRLMSAAHAFYHKVGGERRWNDFLIKKEKLKPSNVEFQDIDKKTAQHYLDNQKQMMDMYPSRN